MHYRFLQYFVSLLFVFWLPCAHAAYLCKPAMDCPAFDDARDKFESIRTSQPELTAFLTNFPKGGNLHHHLMGAMEAGKIIHRAQEKGLCFDEKIGFLNCTGSQISVKNYTASYPAYLKLEQLLTSPRGDRDLLDNHELFFHFFPIVSALFFDIDATFVSEIRKKAAFEQLFYIESTVYWNELNGPDKLFDLLQNMPSLDPLNAKTMEAFRAALVTQPEFKKQVDQAEVSISNALSESDQQLGCLSASPPSACSVLVRFLHEIHRTNTLPEVFAQIIFAFELAQYSMSGKGDEVLGVNIVGPEDHPVAVRDLDSHLAMLAYMKNFTKSGQLVYDKVSEHLSLHAGELTSLLADGDVLASTLGDTLRIVQPARIGHGLSIMKQVCAYDSASEGCAETLLKQMANNPIAVEVPFRSNRVLAGVTPQLHPFPDYVSHQVPVVIATDDPGVLKINLTSQFVEAVYSYNFVQGQGGPLITLNRLIEFTRNGLEFSFLPGKSLWSDHSYVQYVDECKVASSSACKLFLQGSLKARKQMEHEKALSAFLSGVAN